MSTLWWIVLALVVQTASLADEAPATRPFRLGFTLWPADISLDGIRIAQEFAFAHGDVISAHFDGGVPWPEALAGTPFPRDVENSLRRPSAAHRLFVSVTPLDGERKGLAPYHGERVNQPLPPPWDHLALNSPAVKQAYLAYCRRVVRAMQPDWLAIGIESNLLLNKRNGKWAALKELHRDTYQALKREFPNLPICFTTEALSLLHLSSEAKGLDQEGEVAELMRSSDLFAFSLYPFMSLATPTPLPEDFLAFAKGFGKPIAVSESGMTSQDVPVPAHHVTLPGSPAAQRDWIDLLLRSAARDRYEFVINFATTDYGPLCDKLPPAAAAVARIWAWTGLQTNDQQPKPALTMWDGWLRALYERAP